MTKQRLTVALRVLAVIVVAVALAALTIRVAPMVGDDASSPRVARHDAR